MAPKNNQNKKFIPITKYKSKIKSALKKLDYYKPSSKI